MALIREFVTCCYGTRVCTCYHVPRCEYLRAGEWRGAFGHWAEVDDGDLER